MNKQFMTNRNLVEEKKRKNTTNVLKQIRAKLNNTTESIFSTDDFVISL